MIAIDWSEQQDADPKAIQQINFTASLDRAGNTRISFILEETNKQTKKKNCIRLLTRNCKSLVNVLKNAITLNNFIFINIKYNIIIF